MDTSLTGRLRRGDQTALEEIIDRYSTYVAKIIAAFLRETLPREGLDPAFDKVITGTWTQSWTPEYQDTSRVWQLE